MFNVELVPDTRPEDLYKPRLSQEEILAAVKKEQAENFYNVRGNLQERHYWKRRDFGNNNK